MAGIRSITCLIIVFVVQSLLSAIACSVTSDYVRPSNFELVQLAEAIVVATPISQRREEDYATTRFRTDKTIKGEVPLDFRVSGFGLGKTIPSDPADLTSANPEAYAGPCNRHTLQRGLKYVMFLKQAEDGVWFSLGYPFSRVSEDYSGDESLWIKTINYYLGVQQKYEPMEQLRVLKQKYYELIASENKEFDHKLAADIADHLTSRSPYKPTQYLLDTYRALEEEKELPFAIRSPAADKEGGAADAITSFVFGPRGGGDFDVSAQKQFILWALVNGDHPDAMPLFDELSKTRNQKSAVLGAILRFLAEHDRYYEAIEIANSNALRILNNESHADIREFLRGAFSLAGNRGWDEKAAWEDDEYAREWWPEFAIAVNANLRARFGRGATYTLMKESKFLRPENYRDRPNMALALVRSYDDGVVEWAKEEYRRLRKEEEKEAYKSTYELPVGILLEGYDPDNGEFLESLLCSPGDDRYIVLKYMGLHQSIYTDDLAVRAAALDLSDEHKETLMQSLSMFAAIKRKEYLSGQGWGDDDALEIMMALSRGDKIDLKKYRTKPLRCR